MKTNNLTEGKILPSLLRFSLPSLLALLLQALYGAVDLWAVGIFASTADISAVAIGSQTMQILTGLITGLAMGTTVMLGQKIGQEDYDGSAKVVGTSIKLFTIIGFLLSIIMLIIARPLATIMHTPPLAMEQTVSYIKICGGGLLCIVAYNLLSAIFRGMGDSKSPLIFVAIACSINIVGDIILIEFFNLGASGAAIATVLAQAVSVILSIFFIKKKGLPFTFNKTHLKIDAKTRTSIIKLGSPIAFQDMCNEVSYLIIISLVNILGVTASAGVGIAEKLVIFILLIPMSYMQSISAFVAQNVGAGKEDRAKKAMWLGMITASILGFIMAYLSFFHGSFLSSIFIRGEETEVISASAEFLKATSLECFILSLAYCLTGYFNGKGMTTFVMLQGLLSIFLIKIPYAYIASIKPHPTLFDIGLSMVYAALFTLAICLFYFFYKEKNKK